MRPGVAALNAGPLPFARSGLGGGSATPLYRRLQEEIKGAIASGNLKPLDALPGEREIAQTLSISRVTVRKALSGLVGAGLLEQRQGSGTYVAPRPPFVEQPLSRLTSFSEDMRQRGLATTSRWLDRTVSVTSTREAIHLALSPQDHVSRLSRLRFADGVPMAIERAAIPRRYLDDPATVDGSLYDALDARGFRPVRALQRLSAANLGREEAQLLAVPAGSAALSIERVAYLPNGHPVEFTRSFYRGDIYDFVAELTLG